MDSDKKFGLSGETRWRLKREMRAYSSLLMKRSPQQRRLLIFAQGRSGSTVLEDLIASTGYFRDRGELLGANNERVRYPAAYLKGMASYYGQENFVCHVKLYHLTSDRVRAGAKPMDPAVFLRKLQADGWGIIYLNRREKVKQYISNQVALARGAYHKLDQKPEKFRVTIDKEDFLKSVRSRQENERQEKQALEGINHLPIVYEDDLMGEERQAATIGRVLDFIGLEYKKPSTRMRKVNAKPLTEIIVNFDEFQEWTKEAGLEIRSV